MTRLRALTAAACLAASIASVFAADGPLDRAAAALGVDAIQWLEFEAGGRYYQFGQAPAPELPWPAFDVTGYTATLDYARAAVHARYRRVQVQEPGRARPHTDQTQDQYARGRPQLEPDAGSHIHPGQPGRAERRAVDVAAGLHEGGARARRGREDRPPMAAPP